MQIVMSGIMILWRVEITEFQQRRTRHQKQRQTPFLLGDNRTKFRSRRARRESLNKPG
jgi:hypothetical protein